MLKKHDNLDYSIKRCSVALSELKNISCSHGAFERKIEERDASSRIEGVRKSHIMWKNLLGVINDVDKMSCEEVRKYSPGVGDFSKKCHKELMSGVKRLPGRKTDGYVDAGEWRKCNVRIGSHVFMPHNKIPEAMEKFSDLVYQVLSYGRADNNTHSLLHTIANAKIKYLSIHPHSDGNGRISRLLVTYLLIKYELTNIPLFISSEIEKNLDTYYEVLRKSNEKESTKVAEVFILDIITKSAENIIYEDSVD